MDICTSCGEAAVERVDHNGEEQRVCTSCGVIQESGFFSTDAEKNFCSYVDKKNTLFANQAVPNEIQRRAKTSLPQGQREGFAKITVLSSNFRLTSEMKRQVFEMFKRAISSKDLYMQRVTKKVLLAGCCVYAVMRQENWPVTVSHVCNALGCTRNEFCEPYHNLLKTLQITIASTPIEDLVDSYINECEKVTSSEKTLLKSRVLEVLQICKECWLIAGRMPRPILLSAIFISWQSLGPKRDKITLAGFCNQMGFTYQTQAGKRKCELLKVLCTLANNIPWFEPDFVTPKNLYKYLEEILKYSGTVLNDSNMDCKSFRTYRQKPVVVQDERNSDDFKFSDEEIDSYIRSKEEVRFIQNMNKTFEPSSKEGSVKTFSSVTEEQTLTKKS